MSLISELEEIDVQCSNEEQEPSYILGAFVGTEKKFSNIREEIEI